MDLSYAAGLIDGEGYIGIQETGGSMQLRLKVAMTDKGLPSLIAIHRKFGGHLAEDRPVGERTRASHVWRLNGRKAADLIERLQPFLLTKAEPAKIALQFQQMVDAAPKRANRTAVWDEEMRRRARIFRARIQEANRTGPDPAPPILPPERPLAVRKYGEWWEPDEDLFGPVEFSGRLPTSGRMIAGRIYPRAAPASSSPPGLLPTPRATDGTKGGPNQRGSSGDLMLPSAVHQLLPTPTARDWKDGSYTPNVEENALLGRVVWQLLPTPTAMDSKGSRQSTSLNPRADADTLTDWAWKHDGWTGAPINPPSDAGND